MFKLTNKEIQDIYDSGGKIDITITCPNYTRKFRMKGDR